MLVGSDPVGLVDPWGLSPVSVAEMREYRYQNSAAKWLDDHKGIIKGGLLFVGGAAAFAGVLLTGPVGIMAAGALAGAAFSGYSTIDSAQDKETGRVNWGKVGGSMAVGAALGAVGGLAGKGAELAVRGGKLTAQTVQVTRTVKGFPVPKLVDNPAATGWMYRELPGVFTKGTTAGKFAGWTIGGSVDGAINGLSATYTSGVHPVQAMMTGGAAGYLGGLARAGTSRVATHPVLGSFGSFNEKWGVEAFSAEMSKGTVKDFVTTMATPVAHDDSVAARWQKYQDTFWDKSLKNAVSGLGKGAGTGAKDFVTGPADSSASNEE
ncbi:MAG: hypothetical protein Q4P78_02350 [Rothia sp. (in: high G+C Gram-positive bacteria)]|uniref:hypothetical protein n=1 Tax=Rothia sp. (in: high G+C Gram-positive bacteria) TaxID=1885016 RepID=UPI0026DF8CB3|nr:hypothetical protein [Rothia sp. (in: high G+C Gram-positive bacteria)]MDO5750028.1 hypothetical protein [Rothia sp. (in: high G+C Gram-positive bacteria)]